MELKHKKLLLPSFPGDSKEYEKKEIMEVKEGRKKEGRKEGRKKERKKEKKKERKR